MQKLKLNKHTPEELNIFKIVLERINAAYKEDTEVYLSFTSKNPKFDQLQLVDYHSCLNIVYMFFVDQYEEPVVKGFECPAFAYRHPEKPVAWYKTEYNDDSEGHMESKYGFHGFIPDCIADVVFNDKRKSSVRVKILRTLFKDLVKVQQDHKIPSKGQEMRDAANDSSTSP